MAGAEINAELAQHDRQCGTCNSVMKVNTVVYDALEKFCSEHASGREAGSGVRLRHASDDCCGVFYSITYTREPNAADATIALRTSWPWELCSNIRLKQIMPKLIADGPQGLDLSTASSSSAIVAWLLEAADAVTESMREVMRWLASLRCACFFAINQAAAERRMHAAAISRPPPPANHLNERNT